MARTLRVNIIGDALGVNAAFAAVGAQAQAMATRIQTSVGAANAAMVGLGAAGVAAAGVALFRIGEDFDRAFDTIRVGTGATGEVLEGLKDDFRAVATEVPASFDEVATSIADLATRTGLAGQPLQDLAVQLLELSRITDTDIAGNIAAVTRAFADWEVDDQSAGLDGLFRASQASGISVQALGDQLVNAGAGLRQFGFSFEEATALLASFEREGVASERVVSGLRQGLGRLAQAGEEPADALARLVEEIQNAGTVGEANALAVELFGTRAGPDLAEAIRQGRFSVEELTAAIEGGQETILGAAEDTKSFGESWDQFKNNVLVALEPLATRVFEGMSELMAALVPVMQEQVIPAIDNLIAIIETIWPAVEPFLSSTLAGLAILSGVIGAVAALLRGDFSEAWDQVREAFETAWALITEPLINFASFLAGLGGGIFDAIVGWFLGAGEWLVDAGKNVARGFWNGFADILNLARWTIDIPGIGIPGPIPDIPGFSMTIDPFPHVPHLAEGGLVRAQPEGTLAVIGEGRYDEAVVPLKPGMGLGLGGGLTVNGDIVLPGVTDVDSFIRDLQAWERRHGPLPFQTAS